MKLLDKFRRSRRRRLHERMDTEGKEAEYHARHKMHFREAVVQALGTSSMTGRELRFKTWKPPVLNLGLAGFYYRMAKLEDAGVVTGWYEAETIDGYAVRQRWYKLTTY